MIGCQERYDARGPRRSAVEVPDPGEGSAALSEGRHQQLICVWHDLVATLLVVVQSAGETSVKMRVGHVNGCINE